MTRCFAVAVEDAWVVAFAHLRPYFLDGDFEEVVVAVVEVVEEVVVFDEAELSDLDFVGPGGTIFFVSTTVAVLVVVFTAVHVETEEVVVVPFEGVLDEAL